MLLLATLLMSLLLQQVSPVQHEICAWSHCNAMQVQPLPNGLRALRVQGCNLRHSNPNVCLVSHVSRQPHLVSNFTMSNAQLTAAPLTDFCMFNLSGIDLSDNLIDEFEYPAQLMPSCLSRLRWLSMRRNRFRRLDVAQFARFPALEKLEISDNHRLQALYVTSLEFKSNLKVIMAARCAIKQVDLSLVRLPSLQDVDLSFNYISEVTNRLGWRWTLKDVRAVEEERNRRKSRDPFYYARLSVQMLQNRFQSESFGLRRLWGLPVPPLLPAAAQADAVARRLKEFRDAFQSFVFVDNADSTISCDCRLLHAWQHFRHAYADPAEFEKRNALSLQYWIRLKCNFEQTPKLAENSLLTLSDNQLTCNHTNKRNCPQNCTCLEKVNPSKLIVDCSHAGLRSMPDTLPDSVHPVHYVLKLPGNRIRQVKAVPRAQLVESIDLSDNWVTETANFWPLAAYANLHWLDLRGNPLRDLPDSLLNISGRPAPRPLIRLGAESLTCSCRLLEPSRWQQVRLAVSNYREMRCRQHGVALSLAEFEHSSCFPSSPTTATPSPGTTMENADALLLATAIAGSLLFVLLILLLAFVVCCRRKTPERQQDKMECSCGTLRTLPNSCSQIELQQQQQQRYVAVQDMSVPADFCPDRSVYAGQSESMNSNRLSRASSGSDFSSDLSGQSSLGSSCRMHTRHQHPILQHPILQHHSLQHHSLQHHSLQHHSLQHLSLQPQHPRTEQLRRKQTQADRELLLPPPLPPRPAHQQQQLMQLLAVSKAEPKQTDL